MDQPAGSREFVPLNGAECSQSHGHGAEPLTLAAAKAAGRYGHVLFPSGTNEPALELAEKLKETVGQGWADRVFFSDNGSTGIEVALKMALRATGRRYGWEGEVGSDVGVIGLRGGYHGDTVSPSLVNELISDWLNGRFRG
jgi:dethiobiotin synthetase/adenosylmethionine--8-amino-7-oxononanoate aminotransferase